MAHFETHAGLIKHGLCFSKLVIRVFQVIGPMVHTWLHHGSGHQTIFELEIKEILIPKKITEARAPD
jgi:hypothetical protein